METVNCDVVNTTRRAKTDVDVASDMQHGREHAIRFTDDLGDVCASVKLDDPLESMAHLHAWPTPR